MGGVPLWSVAASDTMNWKVILESEYECSESSVEWDLVMAKFAMDRLLESSWETPSPSSASEPECRFLLSHYRTIKAYHFNSLCVRAEEQTIMSKCFQSLP